MKKLLLIMIAALAATASSFAMNLKEAFNALSNLPNVTVTSPDYNLPIIADVVQNGKIAAAYNLDRAKIAESGTATFAILNQIPMGYMINGACNNEVAAFIYATPDNNGSNDVLIAVMSGYRGSVVFMYGTIDDAVKTALQSAPLTMEGNYLNIEAAMPDGSDFNITLSKAR